MMNNTRITFHLIEQGKGYREPENLENLSKIGCLNYFLMISCIPDSLYDVVT